MPLRDYIHVTYSEPHAGRGRALLQAHPELRALGGPDRRSALWAFGLVVLQLTLALALRDRPWIVWLPAAYLIGATVDHALWVLIHECSHHLVFRGRTANRLLAIGINLPLVAPAAMSFCTYHLAHHRHLGEMDYDAGIPGPLESRVIAASTTAKTAWLAMFFLVTGVVRPRRLTKIAFVDRWTLINLVVQITAMIGLFAYAGSGPFKYLGASTICGIGLHPLGARWIQEHFALVDRQETYSYYGPLNKVSFNVGYHNEHHDLVTVPWSRLPQIRRMAPEFYDNLHSYRSWTALLVRFTVDRRITLFQYVVRPSPAAPDVRGPASSLGGE
jgi:sphingolipid delta-4 desaturase